MRSWTGCPSIPTRRKVRHLPQEHISVLSALLTAPLLPVRHTVLFAPLTCVELRSAHTEGNAILLDMSLSINLLAPTIEKVVAKMKTGHEAMVQNMIDELTHCTSASSVLEPLKAVLENATRRGHEYFNVRGPPPPLS